MYSHLTPIKGPALWLGSELKERADWISTLSSEDVAELMRAAKAIEDKDMMSITRVDFPLPHLGPKLAQLQREVMYGRGFALLRGLDVSSLPLDFIARLYWGLGTWLGVPISQNQDGHLLGHVTDIGARAHHPEQRGFQSADSLPFHTDIAPDLVTLMCIQPAKSGGLSSVASAAALYNQMLDQCPSLLCELLGPLAWDRRGEVPSGKRPWYELPVFSLHDGRLLVAFVHRFITSASRHAGVAPLSAAQREAVDTLMALAGDEDTHLSMDFQP
ncbi:MAG: hypothetical protein HOI95_11620, partial [Chromatiales bacterium]|nr:hypothetical protein [Chromatiales bacterium]